MIIPKQSHPKWKELLSGELQVPLRNFFFQMKVTQAKTQIEKGSITIDSAIDELYQLCNKFIKAKNMDEDLEKIFGREALLEEKQPIKNEDFSVDIHIDDEEEQEFNSKNLVKNLKHERELLFLKKNLEQKEKELQEKLNLIITLQEEVIYLRKKNQLLYEGLHQIEQAKVEETKKNEEKESSKNKGWSFFKFK